jgi:hypothetical protein
MQPDGPDRRHSVATSFPPRAAIGESAMPRDLALRLLGGGCLPDFAGKFGYPSIAALSINPGFDVTGELQTIENVCLRSRLGTRTMSLAQPARRFRPTARFGLRLVAVQSSAGRVMGRTSRM